MHKERVEDRLGALMEMLRSVRSADPTILAYLRVNPVALAYCLAKTGGWTLVAYGNMHVNLDRCAVAGPGRVYLGLQWNSRRSQRSQLVARSQSTISVSGNFRIFSGCSLWVNENAVLNLGSGYANTGLDLSCRSGITIGEDVAIGPYVAIRDDSDHHLGGDTFAAPIRIGDHVWVGMRSTILRGVDVGSGAVVAAGSVVSRDVPPRTLVAGAPARVKRTEVAWH